MVLQKILYYWNLCINWLGSSVLNPLIRKFFHSQSIRIPFSCKLLIFDDEIYYLNSCKMILRLISIHALSLWEKETVTFHFSIKDRSRWNCHRILWIWVISLLLLLSWKSFTSFTTSSNAISFLLQIVPFRGSEHQDTIYLQLGAKLEAKKMQKELTRTNERKRMQLCRSMDKTIERESVWLCLRSSAFHTRKIQPANMADNFTFPYPVLPLLAIFHFSFFFFYVFMTWLDAARPLDTLWKRQTVLISRN